MNEVKKVHLGRQQFVISVEAHKVLRDYLAAIEKQPGVQTEVVQEVEMRMAELLTEHGISGEKVVLQEDVDFLKQQLGEPRDFKDDESAGDANDAKAEEAEISHANEKDNQDRPKRFFRDTENAWLAGVASGIGAYLGIDALFVRIAFVLLTFASGTGILVYLLIWLLAPEAKTPSERLQMQGKAVTVDSLKEIVDRADIAGVSERAGRNFGRGIGRVAELFARIVLSIIGAIFITVGIVTMLWTMATGVYMLIHGGQIGNEIAFPLGSREVWFTILAFLAAAIFGFFIFISGLTMATRKWRLPGWSVVALVSVFLVTASVGAALGFDTVPHIRDRFQQAHHSQTRDVASFKSVDLQGQDTAYVFKPDTNYFVELSYLGNVDTKPLTTVVKDGTLTINSDDFMKTSLCNFLCFYSDHDLRVTIHAPSIDVAMLSGTNNSFKTEDQLNQSELKINVKRHSDSHVKLAHMDIASAELTDKDSSNQTSRSLVLTGIKPAAGDSKIQIDDEEGIVHIDSADTFRFNFDGRCDESEPMVYLGNTTGVVYLNDKVIKGSDELRNLRSQDDSNQYNCVVMR